MPSLSLMEFVLGWAQALAAVAAFVTAVVVFQQVREMRRQREISYAPDFAFSKTSVELATHANPEDFRLVWHRGEERELFNLVDDPPPLKLQNVGLGAAKHIRILWDLDVENLTARLRDADPTKIEVNYTPQGVEFRRPGHTVFVSHDLRPAILDLGRGPMTC